MTALFNAVIEYVLAVHFLSAHVYTQNGLRELELGRLYTKHEICSTEQRSMERVSAQCMLFPTLSSKLAQFRVIQGQSS